MNGLCPVCSKVMDPWLRENGYEKHVMCEGKPTALDQARRLRDAAVARVDASADPGWKLEAKRVVWALIKEGSGFTADDVWERLDAEVAEPRALGPVILAAARAGYIVDSGRMVKSRRRHATKITVWEPV
jgi:hypothetical protein